MRMKKHGCMYWLRLLGFGLLGGIFLTSILIEVMYIDSAASPAPSTVGAPPAGVGGREYQSVVLYNEQDDIHLSGWYLPSANRAAVILLHGYGSNRLEMLARANVLAAHGYGVLLYDLRGHGESEGDKRAFGWQDVNDVNAAVKFLESQKDVLPGKIGILGFSIGGQIALRAAAENEQIMAIVADDPGFVTVDDAPKPSNVKERFLYFVSWVDGRGVSLWTGIPIPEGIPEILPKISPRPIFFIDTGQVEGRKLIRHYFDLASEPKTLWEIPETYHGGQFNARPAEYEEKITTFFDNYLLQNE
jgi:pimeloyl-ACP methyl ester carboxylesterase